MKQWTKYLIYLLSMLLIFISIPWHSVNAEDNKTNGESQKEVIENTFIEGQSSMNGGREEVMSLRSETSKTYSNPDSTFTTEISEEPIHYKEDESSKWVPIDNTLVPVATGDAVVNKANSFTAEFNEETNTTEELVQVQEGNLSVSLTPVGPKETVPKIVQNDMQAVTGEVERNTILYTDVYPNTDIKYTVGTDSVKEDIILKQKPEENTPTSFSFKLDLKGLSYEVLENNQIILSDKASKEPVFYLEAPFMYDSFKPEGYQANADVTSFSEEALSYDLEMTIEQRDEQLFIELVPNKDWLESEERVYPVVIDPTIAKFQPQAKLEDTNIRSHFPNNTGGSETTLGVGLYQDASQTNKIRSLLKFDLSSIPSGTRVIDANLNMWLSSVWNDTGLDIGLHEATNNWTEGGATWTKRDGVNSWIKGGGDYSSTLLSSVGVDTLTDQSVNYKWNVPTLTVHRWIHDAQTNKGLVLKANNETVKSWKKFISSDEAALPGLTPLLSVTYTSGSRLGMEEYWSYSDHALSDAYGHVNLGTGNLIVESTDFSLSGRGNSGFSFERTYNSKSVEHSALGYGWSFSGSETITEYSNGNALLQDSDGTTHMFTYDKVASKYIVPAGLYLNLTKSTTGMFTLTDNHGNRMILQADKWDNQTDSEVSVYKIAYEEDRNKNRITYNWQADGKLSGITDATGRTLSFQYQNGRVISTSFSGVKKTAYSYYADGRLKTSTSFKDSNITNGATTTYQYNSSGSISAIIDANNAITKYTYKDSYLQSIEQPTATDNNSIISYDYSKIKELIVYEVDARGNKTTYELDSNYIILSVTDPLAAKTSFTYDNNYNLLSYKNPKGDVTNNIYDSKGNLLSTMDSLGGKTTYTYNNFSQPLTVIDHNGTTYYSYNINGDLLSEKNALGKITSYTYYEPYGNLKSLTRPDGSTETFTYDSQMNYLIQANDGLNRKTTADYDKYGNAIKVTDPKGNSISYEYNEQNQLTSIKDVNSVQTTYAYDANKNLTDIKNGNGNTTKLKYDEQNQLVSYTNSLGKVQNYQYDEVGNLISILNPSATTIETKYDANNRPISIQTNSELKWGYSYDQNGNIISIKDWKDDITSSLTYNALDRLEVESNGKQSIEYDYSPTGSITGIKGKSGTNLFNQLYKYDAQDQLTKIYRDETLHASMSYTANGMLEERSYVNGVVSSYNYDTAQQLEKIKVVKGNNILLEEKNEYDLNGNLLSVSTILNQKIFKYDKLNQLSNQTLPEFGITESYTYDSVGNRLSKTTLKNGTSLTASYSYNIVNQLESVNGQNYTYDNNGNRLSDGKYNYSYDEFDQLIEIQNLNGTTISSYSYDDQGRRLSKTTNGKTVKYHYNQGINVAFETDASNTITAEYTYDLEGLPLTLTKNNQMYYYVYNSNSEIIGLTDVKGDFVASYSYDAWGNILSTSGSMASENPYRYKGYQFDEEIGLYYLVARYYQPSEGVFLKADPQKGDVRNPITQNGYNYANNNPVRFIDPTGEAGVTKLKGYWWGYKLFLSTDTIKKIYKFTGRSALTYKGAQYIAQLVQKNPTPLTKTIVAAVALAYIAVDASIFYANKKKRGVYFRINKTFASPPYIWTGTYSQ
ncbi:DNRLRE domain-containing protein [Planococcus sp. N064]|uniref:DNRLRE domain-containing protein n=1 Tax=Planococcus liqunii TaxID=3058394 RepID=A0ABT8MPB9_9BACL|nr:DNRLRE domain-containing protein [Planococcus sp. N064]MDN7226744.1 DNRLRE domain-containing protein [Planococcus sp. N064]